MRKLLVNIYYSFPVQLLVLHAHKNLLLLFIWILLGLFMTGAIGQKYGILYLFLSPEYYGQIGFWSFFLLGGTYAAMMMAWNLTTYLTSAHYFPFLASLARPFTKFSLNNLIIPGFFMLFLLALSVRFEWYYESQDFNQILVQVLGFILGFILLIGVLFTYFVNTNKDIFSYTRVQEHSPPDQLGDHMPPWRLRSTRRIKRKKSQWRVDTYLTESLRPRIVRSVEHYDTAMLMQIFKQNHVNALIVQMISVVLLVALGYLIDKPFFRIPAGASVFLLCSIIIALVGAISYWFGRWRVTVVILLLILINFLTRYDTFNHKSQAYGLDYTVEPATYSYAALENLFREELIQQDLDQGLQQLENWKAKVAPNGAKPKLVLLSVSGGGLKAAVWTMQVMQQADLRTNGQFFAHTNLITGASGGMMGAGYYRDLLLQRDPVQPWVPLDSMHLKLVAKDVLNAITFAIVSNDVFLPWVPFEKEGHTYVKDRGYAFEQQLDEHLQGAFEKPIMDYAEPEFTGETPLMFLTPAIVNDGRQMVISPQGVTYMMAPPVSSVRPEAVEIDAVDMRRLLVEQDADRLLFSSAMRMNATFPYILPNVHLPTQPGIEVVDAGFLDDFGLKSATRYLHVFKDWVKTNTSGVVLVQVRSFDRNREIAASDRLGTIESILNPLGIAGKVISLQNFEHDNSLGFLFDILGEDFVDIIRFTYLPTSDKLKAGISFHLTQLEYEDIKASIYLPGNAEAMERLVNHLQAASPIHEPKNE